MRWIVLAGAVWLVACGTGGAVDAGDVTTPDASVGDTAPADAEAADSAADAPPVEASGTATARVQSEDLAADGLLLECTYGENSQGTEVHLCEAPRLGVGYPSPLIIDFIAPTRYSSWSPGETIRSGAGIEVLRVVLNAALVGESAPPYITFDPVNAPAFDVQLVVGQQQPVAATISGTASDAAGDTITLTNVPMYFVRAP